ncbi:MAG: signal peptidase II [Desulfobacterales bacterium]|nr:signal peptidase II [Desulfobacterales bacterium]
MSWQTNKYVKLTIIAIAVVCLDQISKAIILKTLPLYQSVEVIPGFFNLTHIHNPGGAFGFLADQTSTLRHFVFLIVSLLAIGLIFYFYKKTPQSHPWLASGFALIFGGAIGNIIDRLRLGEVVDFLDFYIGRWHWPAFNVADSAVTIGIFIFIYHMVLKKLPD